MVYPEGSDFVTPLQEVIRQALTADDTGWVPLSVMSDFSGSVEVRRINKSVSITASVQWGASSNGSTLCQLPQEFRPGRVLWFPWGTNATSVGLQTQVTGNGAVNLFWSSGSPSENNYIRFTQTWFAT